MPADLILDDPTWWYRGHLDTSTRRLRIWRTAPGHLVAVVTERPDDDGTSITNAAEMIAAQLAIEYPDDTIEIIEHWVADSVEAEHFDAVRIDPASGDPTWQPIATSELVDRLGPQLLDQPPPD